MKVADRLIFAEKAGFDTAFVLEFDEELAALSPEKFVEGILLDRLNVKAVIAGESWRFGQDRKGDMVMLSSLGRRLGFEVRVVEPYVVQGLPVSSTRIRGALAAGDVATAGALLGRPHFVRGTVVSGKHRGRELGFPTVNLDCHHTMVPGEGVYAGGYRTWGTDADKGSDQGRPGPVEKAFHGAAAISIGSSPTFRNGSYAVEAHLAGWEGDLYGATVTIAFLERIREQFTFPGGAELSRQIALDVKRSEDLFGADALEDVPI
jgi:riboflavin kinase/FMN adenylyltransferase